jgi:hypothetical protein
MGEEHHFFENDPIHMKRRSTGAPLIESLMLAARWLGTLVSTLNELAFERNAAYLSAFSWVRNINFVQNSPFK